jgi:hypothetical protein
MVGNMEVDIFMISKLEADILRVGKLKVCIQNDVAGRPRFQAPLFQRGPEAVRGHRRPPPGQRVCARPQVSSYVIVTRMASIVRSEAGS